MAMVSMGLIVIASFINLINQGQSFGLFIVSYGLYWFNLGAWLALMPNYIKQKYGTDLYASIYGKVFLGYGISAIIGTLASSFIIATLGSSTAIYGLIIINVLIIYLLVMFETRSTQKTVT